MKIKPKTANQNFSVVVLKNLFIMIISLDVLETPGNGHFIRQGKPCTDEIPRQENTPAGTNKIVFFVYSFLLITIFLSLFNPEK